MEDRSDEIKAAIKRVVARLKQRRHEAMTVPQEWPPPYRVLACGEDKRTGYTCAVVQGPVSLCGYVAVPAEHPDADKWYDDVDVDVHRGLTFRCLGLDGRTWFGFDCAHRGDHTIIPGDAFRRGIRWTPESVGNECKRLADQLRERART